MSVRTFLPKLQRRELAFVALLTQVMFLSSTLACSKPLSVAAGPITLTSSPTRIQALETLEVTGPFTEVCLTLLEPLGRPGAGVFYLEDGRAFRLRVGLIASNGEIYPLAPAGQSGHATRRQEACTYGRTAPSRGREYVAIELTTDLALSVRDIKWQNGDPKPLF